MTPPLHRDPEDPHGTQPIRMDYGASPSSGTQPIRMDAFAPGAEAPPPKPEPPRIRAIARPAAAPKVQAVAATFGEVHEPVRRPARLNWQSVAVSVLLHAVLLVVAGFLTVLVIHGRPKTMFQAGPTPKVRPRQLEHTIRVKQMEQQVRQPQILERLVAQAPGPVALPELPDIRTPSLKDLRDNPLMGEMGSLVGGIASAGGSAGASLTGGSGYTDVTFFGAASRTRAVSILFDISPSMITKGVLEDVRREAISMIEKLTPVTQFNIIVFVDGATAFSADQMVFATQENKDRAIAWLDKDTGGPRGGGFNPRIHGQKHEFSGSTPFDAIQLAVEMGSDTLYVLADDPPYLKEGDARTGVEIRDHPQQIQKYAEAIRTNFGRDVRINAILYKPKEGQMGQDARDFYRRLSRSTGGTMQVVNP